MLELIGAGFGRTGTLSLKAAVERLGFGPCHHMLAMLERPDEIGPWLDAAGGGPVDWPAVYRGYRATIDWPGARFWRDLVAAFPKAKVVLSVRDESHWYESAYETIYRSMLPPDPGTDPAFTRLRELSDRVVWQGEFGGRFAEKEHALQVYREHNAAVAAALPADRLLVYRLGDGWQPLCDFLGVPVPDEPFPRQNDREKFNQMIDGYTHERV